jgi:hypothetical protein
MPQVKALIVLMLLSTLLLSSFAPGVAAQEGTPVTAGATGVREETLVSWTIAADAFPTGDIEALFYRLTLPAGVSLPLLAGPFCDCPGETVASGIGLEVVEDGTYTLRLDAPMTVVRAGAEEEVTPGTEVTLGPGDVARFPDYAAPGEIRNSGMDAVSVVGLAILSQEATGTPVPDLPPEVMAEALSRAVPSDWRRLPPGPVTVMLQRLSLPVGAELAPYEPTGLETMHVVEGQVSLAFIPAGQTEPGTPLSYEAGRTAPFLPAQLGTRRVVSNDEDEPATILVLTISPAGEGAGTPAPA